MRERIIKMTYEPERENGWGRTIIIGQDRAGQDRTEQNRTE